MRGTGRWILGGVVGFVGILGLFLAANSHGAHNYYWIGLGLFAVCWLFVFLMVKNSFDRRDRMHAAASEAHSRGGPPH